MKWACVILSLLYPPYFKTDVSIEHIILLNNNIIPTQNQSFYVPCFKI